jgi:ATP-binding cassette subfamily B protein RaxB
MLTFRRRRKLSMVFQTEAAECGLACLAMVASYHGIVTDLPALRRRFALSLRGASLAHILKFAGQMDLAGRPLRLAHFTTRKARSIGARMPAKDWYE